MLRRGAESREGTAGTTKAREQKTGRGAPEKEAAGWWVSLAAVTGAVDWQVMEINERQRVRRVLAVAPVADLSSRIRPRAGQCRGSTRWQCQ